MTVLRWMTHILTILCVIALYIIFFNPTLPPFSLDHPGVQNFKTIFLSIVLEALPFILLGVIVAALLNVLVTEEMIRRWVPKNPLLGLLFGIIIGIIFPLCECGMIPVIRRLIKKGMPTYIGVVYILSGPIVNPVVFASTYMAFRLQPEVAYSRALLAIIAAVLIGAAVYRLYRSNPLKQALSPFTVTHAHAHAHHQHNQGGRFQRLSSGVSHAAEEFFEMGKYLIFGSIITAAIHTVLERNQLMAIGEGEWSSHLFMMGFAFILSICSTSDAFVASSFTTTFGTGSILTFLVFGPMLDFKNMLMMLAVFKLRFVLLLMLLISVIVLTVSIVYERLVLF